MGSIVLEILIFFKYVERKNKILRLGHYPCLGIWSALVLPASPSPLKAFQSFCPCGEDGDCFRESTTVVSAVPTHTGPGCDSECSRSLGHRLACDETSLFSYPV